MKKSKLSKESFIKLLKENNINQKDKESFLEDLKFKKTDIDKIFEEVSLETK